MDPAKSEEKLHTQKSIRKQGNRLIKRKKSISNRTQIEFFNLQTHFAEQAKTVAVAGNELRRLATTAGASIERLYRAWKSC